jgi:iron-sulfur cluster repair protein YtfE (RIC family)
MSKLITPDLTVNEAILQSPDAIQVFQEAGIDTCCGGARTIGEACIRHGVDIGALLSRLNTEYIGADACMIQR